MKIVCLWSGPRNVSTALMYSFAQRSDSQVVDEPLYGHYLRVSGARHPAAEKVMAGMNCNGNEVMRDLLNQKNPAAGQTSVLFLKHMAHHLVDLDTSFLEETVNAFLIRDPLEMLPSLTVQIPDAGLADTGLKKQWELFQQLRTSGQDPAIIDSRELLLDPQGVLGEFCRHIGIEFDQMMLSWEPGAIPEDGMWAEHWYHSVHQSRGFAPYRPKAEFPQHLEPLLAECAPYYDQLYAHALRARSPEKSEETL